MKLNNTHLAQRYGHISDNRLIIIAYSDNEIKQQLIDIFQSENTVTVLDEEDLSKPKHRDSIYLIKDLNFVRNKTNSKFEFFRYFFDLRILASEKGNGFIVLEKVRSLKDVEKGSLEDYLATCHATVDFACKGANGSINLHCTQFGDDPFDIDDLNITGLTK